MPQMFSSRVRGALTVLFLTVISWSAFAQRPLGVDVSAYQTSINWTTVKSGGIVYAWTKATEGTYFHNIYFTNQQAGARGQGIYIGAYHYARPYDDPNLKGANSADTEATYFWNMERYYAKNDGLSLVPMLDWEDTYATNGFTSNSLSAWVNEWCYEVSNLAYADGVVVRPVVYTGTWYSAPSKTYPGLTTAVSVWPSWMSSYPSSPSPQTGSVGSTVPWPTWNIWQYADTSVAGGDADVYNGTTNSFLQNFLIGVPSFASGPTNVTVTPGSPLVLSAKVAGIPPITFQWLYNGVRLVGQTSSNYVIASVQSANAGGYTLIASNAYATVAKTAFVSVMTPLTNAPTSILAPANLANWWKADGNVSDTMGTNNLIPGVILSCTNSLVYNNGKSGLAFQFNGTNSYAFVSNSTNIASAWTACMWVNRQNAAGTSSTLMGDTIYAIKLEQYNTTREVGITKSGVADYLFSPAYSVPLNQWTHLAFVNTGSQVQLYTNGVLEGSVAVSGFQLPRYYVGADNLAYVPTDYLKASLDELQVYTRALSATEIHNIYSAGSAGLVDAPEFTGATINGSGQVQLNARGLTGKNVSIYSSIDLLNWNLLITLSNPSGTVQYVDSPTTSQKFYKATQ